jgi:single-strand DNA-binding protein
MASLNLNKAILCGRLTADVELKQTPSGVHVCSFTLAVNRRYAKEGEQQADFISVVAWRQTAEFISKYFKKGNSICITGSIQTRSWKDNNGNNRHATEIVADEAMFVDGKSESPSYDAPSYSKPATAPKFEDLKTDEDLPF